MKKVTTGYLQEKKENNEKISMITAYDYCFSKIVDESGIDIILVGDSLGMVFSGYENTLPVTLDEMIYHTKAVCRGRNRAFVVIDLPFLTYHVSPEKAIENAGRAIKESGAEAVKLEGGLNMKDTISAITSAGIPVMGHIGLTPQYIHQLGGFKIQKEKEKLINDAKAVEEAGAFSIVLECIPEDIAKEITEKVSIPTIGIGAGRFCDGQVLVLNDLLGLFDKFVPKFVKQYANLKEESMKAIKNFIDDVKKGNFPEEKHIF
jgi:3-methyl-2-oxobutanoate hydroxymethyltransferase